MDISKFDAGLDVGKSSQYRMTIQFSLGGFSYALLDTATHQLVGLEWHTSETPSDSDEVFRSLERTLENRGLNNKPFQAVVCLIDGRACTLVPTALFDEKAAANYLDFTSQISSEQVVLHEALKGEDCVNVFAVPKTLHSRITSKWNNVCITHSSTVFLNSAAEYAPEGKVAFVNVRNRDFDLAILDEGHLAFFNNFRFNTKDDFAYFLLFALEQNNFPALELPVCFSGLIQPGAEIVSLCSRYIQHLLFVEHRNEMQLSEVLSELPFQYYFLHYQALR